MTEFKDMLVYLRKRDHLTQEQAAKKIGVTRSTLANYETGKRHPDIECLNIIADVYNVNMDTLLCKEEKPVPVRDELHNELYQEVLSMLSQLPAEDVPLVEAYIQGLRARREG